MNDCCFVFSFPVKRILISLKLWHIWWWQIHRHRVGRQEGHIVRSHILVFKLNFRIFFKLEEFSRAAMRKNPKAGPKKTRGSSSNGLLLLRNHLSISRSPSGLPSACLRCRSSAEVLSIVRHGWSSFVTLDYVDSQIKYLMDDTCCEYVRDNLVSSCGLPTLYRRLFPEWPTDHWYYRIILTCK